MPQTAYDPDPWRTPSCVPGRDSSRPFCSRHTKRQHERRRCTHKCVRHLLACALLLTISATAADTQPAIYDLFTRLGSALSESNAIAFMQPFDSSMPDYQLL